MSNIKERIIGAITIMNERDAARVWELIQATFILSNAETVTPDAEELAVLSAYDNGEPDYQPTLSQDEVVQKLGI